MFKQYITIMYEFIVKNKIWKSRILNDFSESQLLAVILCIVSFVRRNLFIHCPKFSQDSINR